MRTRADWRTSTRSACEGDGPLFFDSEEWATIESAVSRIYPSEGGAGAKEAGVARFIDRYLSGMDFIFASAEGDGFLAIEGKDAEAWRARIATLQRKYRDGLRELDVLARSRFGAAFRYLDDADQDCVLEIISGASKPTDIRSGETGEAHVQNISDDTLPFFAALALHTRQGMFCDPVYGGNRERVGWRLIGFPGPRSLRETRDCSYAHWDKFLSDYDWADLIPHLRASAQPTEAGKSAGRQSSGSGHEH